jgi:hypothetical protein
MPAVKSTSAAAPEAGTALNEAAIRAQIERRLSAVQRVDHPVPHVVVSDFFDEPFYRLLAAAWPPLEAFKRNRRGSKYELVPSSPAADIRSAGYDRLAPEVQALWNFFVFTINRRIVAPLLARIFEPEIQERVAQIRNAFEAGEITYPMAGSRDWSYQANVGRFIVATRGYDLKPHLDSMPYLVTVLHYFPDDDNDDQFGTILYKPERPLDFLACARDGSTQYFHDAGVKCEEVSRIPFRPNTVLAFPNTLSAAHGAVTPAHGHRKLFQYHISLKGDDQKV